MGSFVVEDDKIPPDDRTRLPTEQEMPDVWEALERANLAWPIVAPFVALYRNWRALAFVGALTLALNGPRLLELLKKYLGVAP